MNGSELLYDALDVFQNGVNSDIAPILLPKQTLSWSINTTVRGGFAKPRPPFIRRTINFPSAAVQTVIETGLFQGAGYYRPDSGAQQLVAQISGRLFTFTLTPTGSFDAVEITIPGDPNSATANQVWMNQAEKWLIITDGTAALPIFWDGNTARRSAGPSVVLGVAAASGNFPTPRVIGEVLTINLTAPWEHPTGVPGPYDVPVIFNGAFYQAKATSGITYDAVLTNVHAIPGNGVTAGSNIVSSGSLVGWVTIGATSTYVPDGIGGFFKVQYVLTVATTVGFSIGQVVRVPSASAFPTEFDVTAVDVALSKITILSQSRFAGVLPPAPTIPNESLVFTYSSTPDVPVGVTAAAFTNPAVGGTVLVSLENAFTGTDGQQVWIGNDEYTIARSGPVGGSVLYLVNLTDTSDAGAAIPTGSPLGDILSVPELPAGRMGAYGLGHQAMSLTDGISFLYGDAVGGPAGTPAYNYRDAVLKTTENTFQAGGGSFRIPNSGEIITSMRFAAVLDAAYGQGPLQLGTPTSIFTCAVPTDRSIWIALTNPILTQTLIGRGPLAQNSTIPANSDTIFRNTDGYGSMIFGRRDFQTSWGNTPIGSEVVRATQADNRDLLGYGSAITFDNRLLTTSGPTAFSSGVYHTGLLDLNFDPVSSLRGKAPSIWESIWNGPNVLQVLFGIFGSSERCFVFGLNSDNTAIQLFELLREDSTDHLDNGANRVEWSFETSPIFRPAERKANFPLARILNGKVHLSNVLDTVHLKVEYRPDFSASWVLWHEGDVSPDLSPPPFGLGEPSGSVCVGGQPARVARFFQLRFTITGYAVFTGAEFLAAPQPTVVFPAPTCH